MKDHEFKARSASFTVLFTMLSILFSIWQDLMETLNAHKQDKDRLRRLRAAVEDSYLTSQQITKIITNKIWSFSNAKIEALVILYPRSVCESSVVGLHFTSLGLTVLFPGVWISRMLRELSRHFNSRTKRKKRDRNLGCNKKPPLVPGTHRIHAYPVRRVFLLICQSIPHLSTV